jgi:hypothetical protein
LVVQECLICVLNSGFRSGYLIRAGHVVSARVSKYAEPSSSAYI